MKKVLLLSLLLTLLLNIIGCPSPGGGGGGGGDGSSDTTKPAAPSNLTYVNVDATSVKFSWQDNSNNETGFKLYATSLMTGNTAPYDVPGANVSTHTVTGLDTYGYWFHVCAYNANGDSGSSNSILVAVGPPIAAPTNLRATAIGSTSVSLAWDGNSGNSYSVGVERSTTSNSTGFQQVYPNFADGSSGTDTSCAGTTSYWYKAYFIGQTNVHSDYSNVIQVTTGAPTQPPSNLAGYASGLSIILTWSASPTPGVTYSVSRKQNGYSSASEIASGITATTYTDTTVSVGVAYHYSVKAVLAGDSSPYTPESGLLAVLYTYAEVENNGPISWASGQDWYFSGDNLTSYDCFKVTGGYSGSYAIYNPAMYKNYDYDVFKIWFDKGNSIRFTKNSGNVDPLNGMIVGIYWKDSTGQMGGHIFASGGETYTPTLNYGVTITHAYVEVDIPSGITGSNYDFTFAITR